MTEHDGRYQHETEKIDGLRLYLIFRKLQCGLSEQKFFHL